MTALGFLHISDLHLGQKGQNHLWPAVRERLFEDLSRRHSESGPWDVLLFSGDLTNRGRKAEFQRLDDILDELYGCLAALGSKPVLLAVPGNHDLERPDPSDPVFEALRLGWGSSLSKIQEDFWDAVDGVASGKRTRNQYLDLVRKAFGPFVDWYVRWHKAHPLPEGSSWRQGALPGDFAAKLKLASGDLAVVGLNSAFLQLGGDDYQGKLALSVRQLQAACEGDARKWLGTVPLSVLMTHHPPDWLSPAARREFDSEIAPPGLFSAHLYGHMHEPRTTSERISGSPTQLRYQAASLFGLEKTEAGLERIHGYSAGRLIVGNSDIEVRVWPRREFRAASGLRQLVADTSYVLTDENSFAERIPVSTAPVRVMPKPVPTCASLPPETEPLLKAIAAERRSHLAGFAARHELLRGVTEQMQRQQKEGGYLLLVGHEGSGKSALCAKLTDERAKAGKQTEGAGFARLLHMFPWLPRAMLCMCKQISSPTEVAQAILAQAGALLGERLSLPGDPEAERPSIENLSLNGQIVSPASPIVLQLPPRQDTLWRRYQRLLADAIERVVQRHGSAWLIIDAVDELSLQSLAFMPGQLPPGAAVLLTARPGTLEAWCVEHLHAHSLRVPHLTREETALVTGIADDRGLDAKRFNDRVHDASGGWPLLVATVAHDLRKQDGHFEDIRIDGQLDTVFERQADAWRSSIGRGLHDAQVPLDPLREILLLLAVFEPAAPLLLADMQGYLEHLHVKLPRGLADIRTLLTPVAEQLHGLDGGRLRLSLKAFAEYVWQQHLSAKDRRRALQSIVTWLAADDDVMIEAQARFIHHYVAVKSDSAQQDIVRKLVEQLAARSVFQRLRKIAHELFSIDDDSPLAARCMELAAEGGDVSAMRQFGSVLILGRGREAEPQLGQRWMERAIEKGSSSAKGLLGFFLVYGIGVDCDPVRGERYLREAAQSGGSEELLGLASALWVGALGPGGVSEALRLLREAVSRNVPGVRPHLFLCLKIVWVLAGCFAAEIRELEHQLHAEPGEDREEFESVLKIVARFEAELAKFSSQNSSQLFDLFLQKNDHNSQLINQKMFEMGLRCGLEASAGEESKKLSKTHRTIFEAMTRRLRELPADNFLFELENLESDMPSWIAVVINKGSEMRLDDAIALYLQGDFQFAAQKFMTLYKLEMPGSACSLAYMLRRNELPADIEVPGVFELLDADDSSVSSVNRALCHARGVQCECDWSRADEIMSSLKAAVATTRASVPTWWQQTMLRGDPEGHLVVGWLVRLGLATDPEGKTPAERFEVARAAGWTVPADWDLFGSPADY